MQRCNKNHRDRERQHWINSVECSGRCCRMTAMKMMMKSGDEKTTRWKRAAAMLIVRVKDDSCQIGCKKNSLALLRVSVFVGPEVPFPNLSMKGGTHKTKEERIFLG